MTNLNSENIELPAAWKGQNVSISDPEREKI